MYITGCQPLTEIRYVERVSCNGFDLIEPSKDDVLTDGTASQILSYNCKLLACKQIEHPACH